MFQDLPTNVPKVVDEQVSLTTGNSTFIFRGKLQNINKIIKSFFLKKYGISKYHKFRENRNILEITIFTKNEIIRGWEKLDFVIIVTPVSKTNIIITIIMDGNYNLGILNPRISGIKNESKLYPYNIDQGLITEYLYKVVLVELTDVLVK
jgi:hypothetical protein